MYELVRTNLVSFANKLVCNLLASLLICKVRIFYKKNTSNLPFFAPAVQNFAIKCLIRLTKEQKKVVNPLEKLNCNSHTHTHSLLRPLSAACRKILRIFFGMKNPKSMRMRRDIINN